MDDAIPLEIGGRFEVLGPRISIEKNWAPGCSHSRGAQVAGISVCFSESLQRRHYDPLRGLELHLVGVYGCVGDFRALDFDEFAVRRTPEEAGRAD